MRRFLVLLFVFSFPVLVVAQTPAPDSVLVSYQVVWGGNPSGCTAFALGSHDDPVGNGADSDYSYPWNTSSSMNDAYAYPDEPDDWITDEPGVRIVFVGVWGSVDCNDPGETIAVFENFVNSLPPRYAYFTPEPAQLTATARIEEFDGVEADTLTFIATVVNTGGVPIKNLGVWRTFDLSFVFPDSVQDATTTDPKLDPATSPGVARQAELAVGDTLETEQKYVINEVGTYQRPSDRWPTEVSVQVIAKVGHIEAETDLGNPVEIERSCDDAPAANTGAVPSSATDPDPPGGEACPRNRADVVPLAKELVVNATGNAGDVAPGDEVCDTGERLTIDGETVRECTLRAAIEEFAAQSGGGTRLIEFDVPADASNPTAVHVIDLSGPALPAVSGRVFMDGSTQPDGTPIEIDGSGLEGGLESPGLTLGDGSFAVVQNLAFYSFPGTVLTFPGQLGAIVEGNFFGTDWAGSHETSAAASDALRNGGDAIRVQGDDAEIGVEQGNRIYGSRTGIVGDGAEGIVIANNEIGTAASPNTGYGIDLTDGAGSTIGGETSGGNTIQFNQTGGIRIAGTTSAPLAVQGNAITDNGGDGVDLQQVPIQAIVDVGGPSAASGNTITGNDGAGIRVRGDGWVSGFAPRTVIQGNTIEKNAGLGVVVEGTAGDVLVGGETSTTGTAPGNDIRDGIRFDTANRSFIQGNILSNEDPVTGRSTLNPVVFLRGTSLTVGGDAPEKGNVIVGVPDPDDGGQGVGVLDEAANSVIEHNYIGTDGSVASPLGVGVHLTSSTAVVRANVLSGNTVAGIVTEGGGEVLGNWIGTNRDGTVSIPNGIGVDVTSGSLILGGEKAGVECEDPCNVISGNTGPGVVVRDDAIATIRGNVIGLTGDRTRLLGNEHGLVVEGDQTLIGGPSEAVNSRCDGPCNTIAGNRGDGIRTFEEEVDTGFDGGRLSAGERGADEVRIVGNVIGNDDDGRSGGGLGNQGHGVALGAGNHNVVGTSSPGEGNLIAGNRASGVAVHRSSNSTFLLTPDGYGNTIRGNRIRVNGTTAIDLNPSWILDEADGWSMLDAGDGDEGGNEGMNWPYLIESRPVDALSSDLVVLWTGEAGTYRIDVYGQPGCTSGGSAEWLVDTRFVTFEGTLGETAVLENVRSSNPRYTATVTDEDGSTSEVSNCRAYGSGGPINQQQLDADVATAVGDAWMTLQSGSASTPSAPTSSGSSKNAHQRTLAAAKTAEVATDGTFAEAQAEAPDGTRFRPQSLDGPAWDVVELTPQTGDTYDVCLPTADLATPDESVIVAAGPATGGAWQPYDTRLATIDGAGHACADGLPGTAVYTFGLPDAPIPVELADFTARLAAEAAEIEWQTASETNNAGFHVERAVGDAGRFEPVGFVEGKGTTVQAQRYRFVDADLPFAAETLTYRLRQVDLDGTASLSDAVTVEVAAPDALVLHGVFPHPVRRQATLRYELPAAEAVRIDVYDLLGRRVHTLVDAPLPAGRQEVSFDATGLASGVYFMRLTTPSATQTQRVVVVR
jgi:hypothetical protein